MACGGLATNAHGIAAATNPELALSRGGVSTEAEAVTETKSDKRKSNAHNCSFR